MDNYSSPAKKTGVVDAFSKALLQREYQQTLWKGQGSFASVLTLMRATEIQMDPNKAHHS